jgi:transposase
MDTSIVVAAPAGRRRRRHSVEFKAAVIRACRQPGVSIAAVALANGLNANMLRRWVADAEQADLPRCEPGADKAHAAAPVSSPGFIPLAVAAPAADIRIEVQRAGTTIAVAWPSSAAGECATWLRALLR